MGAAIKLAKATIEHLWQETPTVKGLRLKLEHPGSFSFRSGQWVDFYAPALKAVGGYSICSSPSQLLQEGTVDLCVKASSHPCAQWVHSQAAPATQVSVQVGGSFVLAPGSTTRPCLFVAGGIGITALASMVLDLVEQQAAVPQAARHRPFVLYSASAPNEFALLQQLLHLHQAGSLSLKLHTTKVHGMPAAMQACSSSANQQPQQAAQSKLFQPAQTATVIHSRIQQQHLEAAVWQLQNSSTSGSQDVLAYVCGPPQMTDDVVQVLHAVGLNQRDIHTERWW